ncbi:conserved hypothetical protein, secreted, partial [Candidatus Magnetomorum sp. HK-1]
MKGVKGMKLLTGIMSMLLIMGIAPAIVLADVPMTVSYQCNLASAGEENLTEVDMTFILYQENGTTETWQETIEDIEVTNGIVSTVLGESVSLSQSIIDSSVWIGVKINNGEVLSPKTKLTSSVYAIRAAYADRFTQGVPVFDGSNVEDGTISGEALEDNSISSDKIADNGITADDIADNAIDTKKITTNIISVDAEDITNVVKTYDLTKEDQGLVLVEGQVTVNLPVPALENKGYKFTIKKTDDGLRRPCTEGCDVSSNIVTIKCGTSVSPYNINGTYFIENRTHQIFLEYRNSFVSLVSNGEFWYIVESNPAQDIFAPVPGNYGNMEDVELKADTPVNLTWTKATDCDVRSCDTCEEELSYMPYFSKGDKLTSLEIIRESGYPCLNSWISPENSLNLITAICDTSLAPEPYQGTFKVTVVVKDQFGNLAAYCPPGDNIPPEIYPTFWASPYSNKVNLLWNKATDMIEGTGTPDEYLTYSVYYTSVETGAQACLSDLDKNDPNEGVPCNVIAANSDEKATGTWNLAVRGTNIQLLDSNGLQCTVDVVNLQPETTYY